MEPQTIISGAFVTHGTDPSPPEPDPLPSWLLPPPPPPTSILSRQRSLALTVYHDFFEVLLARISSGQSLRSILDADPRGISLAKLLQWIRSDPQRNARYEEAQRTAAEIYALELVEIADAKDSLEDANRSSQRIKTRMYLMERYHPERYAQSSKIDLTSRNLNLNANANLSPDDLRALSTDDLKRMVLERAGQARATLDADHSLLASSPDDPEDNDDAT